MTLRNQFLMATAVLAAASISAGCRAPGQRPVSSSAAAATKTYVEPGKKDEYLPVLLGRTLRAGVRGGIAVDAAHLDDSRIREVSGDRLRL